MFIENEFDLSGETYNNLEISVQSAYNSLIDFSQTDDFLSNVKPIFGENITANTFQELIEKWRSDDLQLVAGFESG